MTIKVIYFFGASDVMSRNVKTAAAHLDDPEVTAVPGPMAVPELLCLPGQVCEDPEPREPALVPDPSALNPCHGESLLL